MIDKPRPTGAGREYRPTHHQKQRAMREAQARIERDTQRKAGPLQETRRGGWGALVDAFTAYTSQRGKIGLVQDAREVARLVEEGYDMVNSYAPHAQAAVNHFRSRDDVSLQEAAQIGMASAASQAMHEVVKQTARPKKRNGFWSRLNPATNVRDAAVYAAEPAAHSLVHWLADRGRHRVQEYHRPGSRRAVQEAAERTAQIGQPSAPTVEMPPHLRPTPQNFDKPRRGVNKARPVTQADREPIMGNMATFLGSDEE